MVLFTIPFSVANIVFLLTTIITWAAISGTLEEEKNVELSPAQQLLTGLPPAFTFGFSLVYYLIPSVWKLVFGTIPNWAFRGAFWDVMQVVGAIIFTASAVSWVSLVEENE